MERAGDTLGARRDDARDIQVSSAERPLGVQSKCVHRVRGGAGGVDSRETQPATISVVIPCYNYAHYLKDAVESVLSQPGVDVNVVIVDDASSDTSADVAQSIASSDSRVMVKVHERNCGPVRTFNDGLMMARGEFLVRLDADDLLTPGSLRRSVEVMRAFPSIGLVYGHPIHFSGSARPAARTLPTHWTIWPGQHWLRDRCRDARNVITSPEVVMRSSIVRKVGGQKDLAHTHDMEMWFRIAAYSDIAYIHGADQAWHREHDRSLSAREVDHYRDLLERREAFDVLFDGVSGALEDLDACRRDAYRAMAGQALELACRELDHGRDGAGKVERFLEAARSSEPDLPSLPEWKAYQSRLGIPPVVRRWHPASLFARVHRRFSRKSGMRKWHKDGIYRDWPS